MKNDKKDIEYLDGTFITPSDDRAVMLSSGLFYGAGCFETIRVEKCLILQYHDHMSRLYRGLHYLGINKVHFPELDEIKQTILQLIEINHLNHAVCRARVQCFLTEKSGYHIDVNNRLLLHISVEEVFDDDKPVRLITTETRVVPTVCRPSDLKLSNMLHYRNARREALSKQVDDGLMLTIDNYVAETSIANIFWKKDGVIYTPSIDCDILPGTMRNLVIKLLTHIKQIKVNEGKFRKEEIIHSELVWVTNSILECKVVSELDGKELNYDHKFFLSLMNKLMAFKKNKME
ncbi:MAG: aminotransferase class IV [Balneolaceae bacterium]